MKQLLAVKSKRRRLKEIKMLKSMVCEEDEDGKGCGKRQPIYRKKGKTITVEMKESRANRSDLVEEDRKQGMRASEVYDIFRKIDDATVVMLGLSPKFSRPESLLIRKLVVAPPAVRPSIELSSNSKSEDDLTHLYMTILSANIELKNALQMGANRARLDELTNRLQDLVEYLMNNDKGIAKQKGGRPIKSISQRLKGKEGRLRGNLMGKRVDFSSRTVVSPDPSLDLDQLGVPLAIATELTIPETVTQLNIEFLRGLVDNMDQWPGARYYISKLHNDQVIDLLYAKQKPNLQYGDIVERHLIDGDYVIFNRQPSLHKMSIMGHRVKVLPGSSFRLNLAVTTPYNADFDGDEMNMHVPQKLESKAEIKHIMHVPRQIVTPQSSRPVMGLNQDVLMAIRLFTFRDNFLDRGHLFDILMHVDDWNGEIPKPAILKPRPMWSGKQILSMIIPKMNYYKPGDGDQKEQLFESDETVVIRKGELLAGIFKKKIVGNTSGSLLGCIWIDFGPERTRDFMSFAQKIINCWVLKNGFTVGIEDTIVPVDSLKKIEIKKCDVKTDFHKMLQIIQKDEKDKSFIHQPGKTIIQSFEYNVNTMLNICRGDIGKMLNQTMSANNNIKHMINAGSKGNDLNISQICGIVGQQNVEGQRIPFGFNRRTLPHFLKDDFGPESRGFVANSYYKGLNPEEFFFHTMGGREGLIDTAVKTSTTGYMQRRLVKALEDVMIQYDGTVRDSYGNVIQFVYGDDGMAGEFIEQQGFEIIGISDRELRKRCFFEIDEGKEDLGFEDAINRYYGDGLLNAEVRESLLKNPNAGALLYEEYNNLLQMRAKVREYFSPNEELAKFLPVNLDRVIQRALYHKKEGTASDLSPLDVISKLDNLCENLDIIYREKDNERLNTFSGQIINNATFMFRTNLRLRLCSRRVILDLKFNRDAFYFLVEEIKTSFHQAKIQPGEMTGSIAAQSMGETLTQMTLNTFHFAGVSSQNITLGVPRIQEIINCSRNIKGSSMTIYLNPEHRFDKMAVTRIISLLEKTTIGQIAKSSEIFFDPDPSKTVIAEDQYLIFYQEEELKDFSPWVIRITIDQNLLSRKGIKFKDVVSKIEQKFSGNSPFKLQTIDSLETADPVVLRVRLVSNHRDFNHTRQIEQFLLEDLVLKGSCKKVSYREEDVKIYSETGIASTGRKEFVLETSGSNLREVLKIPMVDKTRTTSNHIWDIYDNFGIEATRLSILQEIRFVFKFFAISVNYRHVSLLADTICSNGKLMSISRTGINRVYLSPLRKSSFEETVDILLEAAVYADNDRLRGVTENVMFGQLAKMGTGAFDILMDDSYLCKEQDTDKNNVSQKYKYIPNANETTYGDDFDDGMDSIIKEHLRTPYHIMNTPGPSDFILGPQTHPKSIHGNSSQCSFSPAMPNMSRAIPTPVRFQNPTMQPGFSLNSPYRPHIMVNTPLVTQGSSPMRGSISVGQSTEMKYSPVSPVYGQSSHGMASPGKIGTSYPASPSYSPNSSSPYYSPNNISPDHASNGQPAAEKAETKEAKKMYDPQTPAKKEDFTKKDQPDKYSDEEY